jgi:hypothetical protein
MKLKFMEDLLLHNQIETSIKMLECHLQTTVAMGKKITKPHLNAV